MLDTPESLKGVPESEDTLVIAASHDSDETLVGVEIGAITSGWVSHGRELLGMIWCSEGAIG